MKVQLVFQDSHGRQTSRELYNTATTIADTITNINSLVALWNPLTDLSIVRYTISTDGVLAITGAAVSNIDENVSLKVTTDVGVKRDFNLPDVPDAKVTDGQLSSADLDLVALMAAFETGGTWRVNQIHPEYVVSWVAGILDK